MELAFDSEQNFLREAVRGTVQRDAPLARVREWVLDAETADVVTAHALAVDGGFTGIGLPEEVGGQGGSLLELTILAEELGRGAVPADGLYATILTALALHASGDEAVAELIGQLSSGKLAGALALTAGRPLDLPATGGSVPLVLGAPGADVFIAYDGTHLHVHRSSEVSSRTLVDRTRSLGDVTLAGPPELSVAIAPEAMARLAGWAAVLVAADTIGACERMLDLTVEYVGQRLQFGVAVGSFQAVKHAASEMLVQVEGARAALHYAGWAGAVDEPGALTDAWVAKLRSARAATFVADKALFLHGAVGYTWEHDLQLLFKRAKSDAALFGAAGTYEDRIADALELLPT